MSPSVLHRRGVSPLAQQPARLANAQPTILAFRHRAGYATLLQQQQQPCNPAELSAPLGVLYTLSKADLERLRRCEQGYRTVVVQCQVLPAHEDAARSVDAVAFVSQSWNLLPTSVPPRAQYLGLLKEGAAHAGLPAEYLQRLAAVPTHTADGWGLPAGYYDTPTRRLSFLVIALVLLSLCSLCM